MNANRYGTTTNSAQDPGDGVAEQLRDRQHEHGQHAAEREQRSAVDRDGAPVGDRRAQARAERAQRAGVVEHDQRRREPHREQRRQRAHRAEQHRQLKPPAGKHFLGAAARARQQRDEHAAVDQRRGQQRQRDSRRERRRPRESARTGCCESRETGARSAALPPRSCVHAAARKPTANTGFSSGATSCTYARPRPELREHDQEVVSEEQQQPRQRPRRETWPRLSSATAGHCAHRGVRTRRADEAEVPPTSWRCDTGKARLDATRCAQDALEDGRDRARASARRRAADAGRTDATARSAAPPRAAAPATPRVRPRQAARTRA